MNTIKSRHPGGRRGFFTSRARALQLTATLLLGIGMTAPLTVQAQANTPPVGVDDSASVAEDEIKTISVLPNDSDAEDLIVQDLQLGTPPAHGTLAIVPDPACEGSCFAIEYTPEVYFGGTVTFTYFPKDSGGLLGNETTVTVDVTRISPNQAPNAVNDSYSMPSAIDSSSSNFNVLANDSDVDGDSLTVTAVGSAVNGSVTLVGGTVVFRPNTGYVGPASFTYTIWDGITAQPTDPQPQHFATATVSIDVQNRAPNPQSVTATTTAGTPVGFAAITSQPDPENQSVTVTAFTQPANGSVVASGSTGFEYTPNAAFVGVDTFGYTLTDSFGASAPGTAQVTVTALTNAPPVANNDFATTRSGRSTGREVIIDVLANDSDPDGDPLSVNVAGLPSNGGVSGTGGLLHYTPNPSFVGTDTFTYTVSDLINAPVTATVTITVNADLGPVANDDSASVSSWTSPSSQTTVQIPVAANDTDPEGDTVDYLAIVQQPQNGSVSLSCPGATCNPPDYSPNAGFVGTDTFTYVSFDTLGEPSNTATVTVNVTAAGSNSPPIAVNDVATTRSGPTAGEQVGIDVLANDSDPDNDPLSINVPTLPVNGSLIISPSGGFLRYTPNAGFTGTEVIAYDLSDGINPPVPATLTITVNADNAPVAVNDSAQTTTWIQGQGPPSVVQIPVLANDSDPDSGDTIAYRDIIIVQQPANGSVTQSCAGNCNPPDYQPNTGFSGTDTFTYRAVDQLGAQSNIATVTINVTGGTNSPPVAVNDVATTRSGPTAGLQVNVDVLVNDSDPNNDQLTVTVPVSPTNGILVVTPSNVLRYTPNPGFTGTEVITYELSDSVNPPVSATATITVNADTPPVAADDAAQTVTWIQGQSAPSSVQIAVFANDVDPDSGDTIAYRDIVIVQQPANGSISQDCLGACSPPIYQPNSAFTGTDTFTYRAVNQLGAQSNIATVTINVTASGSNSPPVAVNDVATTRSGPTAGVSVVINALSNDSDPDGDTLQFSVISGPTNGSLAAQSNPLSYTPFAGFTGTDVITYAVSDGINPPVNATVTITVTADNAPVAVNDSASTTTWIQGQSPQPVLSIPVLANDTDPDAGDVLAYNKIIIVTQPPNGNVNQACGSGGCNPPDYRSNSGFTGTDTFTYRAVDQLGAQSNIATVTIQVINPVPGNLPPVAVNDNAQTVVGAPVTIDALANDSDPDGQLLTIVGVGTSSLGTATIVQNQIVFTPNGTTGTNAFSYTIADTFQPAGNATAAVIITVNAAPTVPPTAVIAGGNRTIADSNNVAGETVVFDFSQSVSNNPGATITSYMWDLGSSNGTSAGVSSTPQASIALADGINNVQLRVTDSLGQTSAPTSVTITVTGPGARPVATISVGSTTIPDSDGQPGEPVPFQGSATDADGTVAVATFRWTVNGQAFAAADGKDNPVLALVNGANAIGLTVTDNTGLTGTDTINVTVGETNAIAEIPGVSGNENLENTAAATDSTCSALLKADTSNLTPDQLNLRATCDTIYANVDENPQEVVDALETISSQQVTAQQSAAIDYTSAQLMNVAGRLTALRQGAKGVSLAGLNIGSPVAGVPIAALASLTKTLFGEGGSSGEEEEGGLLDDKLGIFVNGSIRFGDKQTTANETGFDFGTKGLTVGADYRFNDAIVAGLALGYGTASADFVGNQGKQDSDSYSGTVYGSWYGARSYIDGIASLGTVSYDSVRNINLFNGAIVDKALGNTDALQWALGMSGGFDFGKGGLRFGPNLAVNYIKADIDGFTEKTTGTSGLAMSFADQSADSLTVKAGGHFNYSFSRKWGILSPQARFDLVREFANDSQAITIRYANDPLVTAPGGAGGSFVIFTDNPDEYYFLWGVGLAAQFMNGFSGFIDYESTEALDSINSAEISFGLRYQTHFK